MITAAEMHDTAKKFHSGTSLRTVARRIGLEQQIKNAASEGYYSIEVQHIDDVNVEYFRARGFKVEWEKSIFLFSNGHWCISWRNEEC